VLTACRLHRPNGVAAVTERPMDPNVHRRMLRTELRRLREACPFTQKAVADEMSWSVSKLIRIESGSVTISINDLKALLALYGVRDPDTFQRFTDMARSTRRRSWLDDYRGVASPSYLAYLAYEEAANRSYNFQPTLVPGLLQTEEYAAEILRVVSRTRAEGLIELRVARQERTLARAEDLELYFVIDESVIRRPVGNAGIMKRQIEHLIELSQQPHISIEVAPFSLGFYRSLRLPYVVLEFPEPQAEAILYLEDPHREAIVREDTPIRDEDQDDLAAGKFPPTYLGMFSELLQRISPQETERKIESALREFGTE
jgi:transcriptional regulator with XRE-family HTH domain